MKYVCLGLTWSLLYLTAIFFPLSVMMIGQVPGGNGFAYDMSVFLGFAGTSMIAVTFFLTARFKRVAMPFGIDLLYYFHRQISYVVFFIILVHPIILTIDDPGIVQGFLSPYMLAGFGSLLCLFLLIVLSTWRKKLKIHYDLWRISHLLFAIVALLLAIMHIDGVGGYIATPLKRMVWGSIIASCLLLMVYVRLIKPIWMLKHHYTVKEIIKEKGNTWTIILHPEGHDGITFQPGQFAWLTLFHSPFSMKGHPFSISSSAEQPSALGFSIKELGDFTRRMKKVVPGQKAFLDGPYGAFSCDRHQSPGYVFIAGGIGIAPIMSMLRTLADRKSSIPLFLIYAYDSLERLTFDEEIQALGSKLNLQTCYVLKSPPQEWQGETGILSPEIIRHHLPPNYAELDYFVCGPVPMIHMVERTLFKRGVPLSSIHSELFDLV